MDAQGQFTAELIDGAARAYASGAVQRQLARQPDVFSRYGSAGFTDLVGDTALRLAYLSEALATGRGQLLDDQVAWQKVALIAREIPLECLAVNLECLRDELAESLPAAAAPSAVRILDHARFHLDQSPDVLPSLLLGDHPHLDLTRHYVLAVLEGRRDDAIELVLRAHAEGVSVAELHEHVLGRAQGEIGRMWQMNEIHVAEEHFASQIAAQILARLRIVMPRAPANGRRAVCATVGGNLHEIGLQMVADHLEMGGWQPIQLGASMPAVDLVHGLRDFAGDLLAISTSIATQVRATADLIRFVRQHTASALPVLVGGPPFRAVPDLWNVVGADGCAADASSAAVVAARLVSAAGVD
ncbi:MAG: cobalamin-dependent protein [Planctomycetes bacterium]|nr:cobalamin-dependent protein [Planctomycetota bacterium]